MREATLPLRPWLASLVAAAALVASAPPVHAQNTPVPVARCTATNVGGSAYGGQLCGGSVIDNCTPGAMYQCEGGGVQDPVDNCVLVETCSTGCLTGRNSTPPTANTDFPVANDACWAGTRPLTLSASDVIGGDEVTVTATLSDPQSTPNGPILNLSGGGVLVPHPFCAVPQRLAAGPTTGASSVTFNLPTAVVDAPATAHLSALISYRDSDGFHRNLVSIPWSITVRAGGTEPPAPAVKSITVGPSLIGPGQLAVVDVELAAMAPARGILVSLASSHPSIASIIVNGQPFVQGGCRTGGGAANVQAADFVDATTAVTISATSGAPNEVPAAAEITVSATVLDLSKVTLAPKSVLAGSGSTGTVTMTRAAPAGGAEVFLSSSSPVASVPASVTVPPGATTATFAVTTRADAAFDIATIGGSYDGGFDASALLTVWPAGTPQAVSALSITPARLVGPASATGTVTMKYAPPSEPATVALSSSNTAVAQVPPSVSVAPGTTETSFTISTSEVTAATSSTIAAAFGGGSQTATITVDPATPPPSSAVLSAFSVAPTTVAGGDTATGTVTLASAAPAGGVAVNLGSQIPTVASVPASVTVPAGATSATFAITTSPPSGTTTVGLSASLNGNTLFSSVTVTVPTYSLSSVSVNPTSVAGGTSATGTVTLGGAAPGGGIVVSLGVDSTAASVPSSVTVPEGSTSATFTVTTTAVAANTVATVTATWGNVVRSADLTITVATAAASGFLNPRSNAAEGSGDGNGFESNPSNAYGDDSAVAADMNSGSGNNTSCTASGKDRHRFYDFGITVPSGAAIAGIEVRLDARADSTADSPIMCVQLSWDAGRTWTAAKSTARLGTSLATFTLGGTSDTWGRTWAAPDMSDSNFRLRITNVSKSTSRDFFLEWVAVRPHFATGGPAQLSAVSVSPSSVTGGTSSTGTVTLTAAAPAGGAVIALSSSNAGVASVPASVTVAAGATSASFAVSTQAVTSSTSVTISASYDGVTRTTTLGVNAQSTDAVTIDRAEYRSPELRVEATSTSTTATLQVYVSATNELIGTLSNEGRGRYSGTFSWPVNPENITVRSSAGGSASRPVTAN